MRAFFHLGIGRIVVHVGTLGDVGLPHLPKLFQVGRVGILGVLSSKADKAPLAIVLRVLMLQFGLCGQGEKGFRFCIHLVNDSGVNPMSRNGSETNGAVCSAEVIDEGLPLRIRAVREVTQIERGNPSDKVEMGDRIWRVFHDVGDKDPKFGNLGLISCT